jgi:hypothetical protein
MQWLSSDHVGFPTKANATEEPCSLHGPCRDVINRTSLEKISGRDPHGAWRQDELIGSKPSVVK